MSWSYRICREEIKKVGSVGYNIKYSIKEVYDKPKGHTIDDIAAVAYIDDDDENMKTEEQCVESIRNQLVMMLLDTTRPVYKIKRGKEKCI